MIFFSIVYLYLHWVWKMTQYPEPFWKWPKKHTKSITVHQQIMMETYASWWLNRSRMPCGKSTIWVTQFYHYQSYHTHQQYTCMCTQPFSVENSDVYCHRTNRSSQDTAYSYLFKLWQIWLWCHGNVWTSCVSHDFHSILKYLRYNLLWILDLIFWYALIHC